MVSIQTTVRYIEGDMIIDDFETLGLLLGDTSKHWQTTLFTTVYVYYDTEFDQFLLQVFSQGCAGPYYETEIHGFPTTSYGEVSDLYTKRYEPLGVL